MGAVYVGQRVNRAAIRYVLRDEDGPVGRDLDDMSRRVLVAAQSGVGVQSGLLLSTIRRGPHEDRARGPYRDIIAGKAGLTKYLGYHIRGTTPHVIRARRKKSLRFVWHGQVVFRRQVRHPGNKPNDFLTRALNVLH